MFRFRSIVTRIVVLHVVAIAVTSILMPLALYWLLDEAANNLHVSINTVRTHLRGIYGKLGTNKQYRVTALLNNSAARLM